MKKYIYGIILKPAFFGTEHKGLKGKTLNIVNHKNLSALVSDYDEKIALKQEDILLHNSILVEAAIKHPSLLPMRFGMIANSNEEIKEKILSAHHDKLEKMLKKLHKKIEVAIKASWLDTDSIVRSFREKKEIKNLKKTNQTNLSTLIEAGRIAEYELDVQRFLLKEKFVKKLSGIFSEYKDNGITSPDMIFDLAFLIDKEKEPEFEKKVSALDKEKSPGKINIQYIGPLPNYDFSQLSLTLN